MATGGERDERERMAIGSGRDERERKPAGGERERPSEAVMSGAAAGLRKPPLRCEPAGDRALLLLPPEDGSAPPEGEPLQRLLAHAAAWLEAAGWEWLEDAVPAYESVLAVYDPVRLQRGRKGAVPWRLAQRLIEDRLAALPPLPEAAERAAIEIPVRYGGEHGPDLEQAARRSGMTPSAFIAAHSKPLYRVVMLGFLPGFPYLDGLPPELAQPRLDAPRPRVPAGSVGIGGAQTGLYPSESPGGWQLIGRTDVLLFDPGRERPALLAPGDRVRFVPVER
ncbi:5-oxoprolinase subunit PxpB [Paenibacillus sp. FSL W8-1187]|uniref:5-oxoprolinase subunit PxpB n=1 Tax=Paenibacillus sp. FSL W8-1187 TaxID=2975339 RepID=UPI0030DC0257